MDRLKRFGAICAVLCFFGFPYVVAAHATPITYEPEASSVLERTPAQIKIRFTERLEPAASSIVLYDQEGRITGNDKALIDEHDPRILVLEMPRGKESGTYTVTWSVVSADDGHFTKGAYSFAVGLASPPPTSAHVTITHRSPSAEAGVIWIELVGQALLVAWLALFVLFRGMMRSNSADMFDEFWRRSRFIVIIGVVLVMVGGTSYIMYKASDLASQGSINGAWKAVVIFSGTVSGKYTLYRIVAALIFACAVFAGARREQSKGFFVLAAVAIAFMIVARARVSHAAASHVAPMLSIGVNALHLFFKDLWIGGLLVFSSLFVPLARRARNVRVTADLVIRFSKTMIAAFIGGGLTGIYIIWLHLKSFENITTTDWGAGFVVLSIMTVALIGLRVIHQVVLDRRLVYGKPIFMDIMYAEAAVGLVLLFATSVLIITTPPVERYAKTIARAEKSDARITLESVSEDERNVMLRFESQGPIVGVTVVLSNAAIGIESLVVPSERRFENSYAISREYFSPDGTWHIDVTGRREGAYDAVAGFDITTPNAFAPPQRGYSFFDLAILGAAFGLLCSGAALWAHVRMLERARAIASATNAGAGAGIVGGGVLLACVAAGTLWFGASAIQRELFVSSFRRTCESQGDAWHVMPPMRRGVVLSSTAVAGCMTPDSQFHFTDEREYRFYRASY